MPQARCAATMALPGGRGGASGGGDRELVGRLLARIFSTEDPVYQKVQRGVVAALRLLLLEKVRKFLSKQASFGAYRRKNLSMSATLASRAQCIRKGSRHRRSAAAAAARQGALRKVRPHGSNVVRREAASSACMCRPAMSSGIAQAFPDPSQSVCSNAMPVQSPAEAAVTTCFF